MRASTTSHPLAHVRGVDIRKIRYFLVATEHLSYARAALALGVSASTLSRQIHRLEDSVGVSLFERHRNGIWLTAARRQFQHERLGDSHPSSLCPALRAGSRDGGVCIARI